MNDETVFLPAHLDAKIKNPHNFKEEILHNFSSFFEAFYLFECQTY